MREVKIREEEYDLVKDILDRVQGLPAFVQLACRERRLLARGRLVRDFSNEKRRDVPALFGNDPGHYLRPLARCSRTGGQPGQRQSKLYNAIQGRNIPSTRSGSMRSTASSQLSEESHLTSSSSTPPVTPIDYASHMLSSMGTRDWDNHDTADRGDRMPSLVGLHLDGASRQSAIHAFVFTDLIILASSTGSTGVANTWRLLEDVGISRILGVELDGQRIVLDLLPMDTDDLDTGSIPDSAPVTPITLSVPSTSSSGAAIDPARLVHIREKWISALQQCSQHTLRSLSFPPQMGRFLEHGPLVETEFDARQSVMAILASGLPLPKSPSTQLEEALLGQASDTVQQEREERGWWSLRFHQVLRETRRGEFANSSQPRDLAIGSAADGQCVRGRPGSSRPRPLKLPSLSSYESFSRMCEDGTNRC